MKKNFYISDLLNNRVIKWVVPNVKEEYDEIERAANEINVNTRLLVNKIKLAKPVLLQNDIWSRLQNTDSWDTNTIAKVKKLSIKYKRDYISILRVFEEGGTLPSPMIIRNNFDYILVGGNTRLMVARAVKIKPMVVIVNI